VEKVRTPDQLAVFIEPEDHKAAMAKLRQAEATLSPVELEGRIRGGDGQIRWLRSISRPTSRPDGAVEWDGVMLDVTEEKRAQQQLEERTRELATAKQRFEALVSSSSEIVWTVNPEGLPDEDSPSRRAFTGETLEEWMGGGCYDAIHPADRAETARLWAEGRRTGVAFTSEYRLRHFSGQWRWMRVHRVPLRNEQGVLTGWVGMNKDITEEKEAKQRLELLNSELTHRVKNLLAVIIAIAQESGKRAIGLEPFLADFSSRLEALAQSHDLLVKGGWQSVELKELIRSQLAMFAPQHTAKRLFLSGPSLNVKPAAAQALGMVFHELATNAVKHGAFSNSGGSVEVTWACTPADQLELIWKERGGPAVGQPERTGFGTVVVTKFANHVLGGEPQLVYAADGVQWSLKTPRDRVVEPVNPSGEPEASREEGVCAP
jgi:PAS domain S-box-containing protein